MTKENNMQKESFDFFRDLNQAKQNCIATTFAEDLGSFRLGLDMGIDLITSCRKQNKKVIFVGNGGSAGIASHLSVDFWKNGNINAIAFNDSSLLTCISNDFGYERVFEEPIKRFANSGDLLIAISSSGGSENILRAVDAAKHKGCSVMTLSGFLPSNPLRIKGDLNFYLPSDSYGIVEVGHLAVLHAMLDEILDGQKCENFVVATEFAEV
jgi:D-sedoheptulose 7-phosphate isomerase